MRKLLAAAAFAVLGFQSTGAIAATGTATLSITATITTACTFASPTQTIDLSTAAATSGATSTPETLGITCTSGDPVTVTASTGNNAAACNASRAMKISTSTGFMSYDLKLSGIQWCSGSGGSSNIAFTGTGALQSFPYTVTMPGYAADVANLNRPNPYPVGSYSDSITLTATF